MLAMLVAPALLYPFFQVASAITGTRLIAYGAMSCAGMLVATALAVRWFGDEWGDSTALGASAARGRALLGGLGAGWLAISVPTGLLIWRGAMAIEPAAAGDWWRATGMALVMLAPSALTEELLVRGYAFTLLQRMRGSATAVIVTSVVFGVLHLFNPDVSAQAIVMVALAGAFLSLVRLAFDSLWAAWAAHLAYNFVQLAVFHAPVSGLAIEQPYYRLVSRGPAWLTGGAWGPEAGAGAALGMLGVTILLAVYAGWMRVRRREGRFVIEWRPDGRRES